MLAMTSTAASTRQASVKLELAAAQDAELEVHELNGREAISELYSYRLDFWLHGQGRLDVNAVIGGDATLLFEIDGEEVRRVHGVVRRIDELFAEGSARHAYRVLLVPHAHTAELVDTLDVFTGGLTVPELIGKKLGQLDVRHDLSQLMSPYAPRDFYMQYKETDWAFVCRHAERLGIAFVFSQDGSDGITFVDDTTRLARGQTLALISRPDAVGITALEASTQTVPTLHVVMDYNELTPDIDLTCSSESSFGAGGGVVEYGPLVRTTGEADALAKVRREESDGRRRVWRGTANSNGLAAGQRITVEGLDDEVELLIVELEQHGTFAGMHGAASEGGSYRATFVAIDADKPFRPARKTRIPRVEGLISAVVEPSDYGIVSDYAKLDPLGRYMVKFRFDSGDLDGRASCPVRMATPTAGPDYGMHFPLKPGVEIAVGFINGDPDRPVIVGALHNATVPAVVRDQNATFNVIKPRSGINRKMKDA